MYGGATEPAIAIDYGTSKILAASVDRYGAISVIENPNDHRTNEVPAFLSFTDDEITQGNDAKNNAKIDPQNTIFDIKRMLSDIQKHHMWPFDVTSHDEEVKVKVTYRDKDRHIPQENLLKMQLEYIQQGDSSYLERPLMDAVITVPCHYNELQRNVVRDSATRAGLNVLQILDEQTAAVIKYVHDTSAASMNAVHYYRDKGKCILVYDFGAGNCSVSVFNINGYNIEVLGTAGAATVGGRDLDDLIIHHFIANLHRKEGVNLRQDLRAMARLRSAAEILKINLSQKHDCKVEVDPLYGDRAYNLRFDRKKFEDIIGDSVKDTITIVQQALANANVDQTQVEEVIMMGGCSRIPLVQEYLKQLFRFHRLKTPLHPTEDVGRGAAILAANLQGSQRAGIRDINIIDDRFVVIPPEQTNEKIQDDIYTIHIESNHSQKEEKKGWNPDTKHPEISLRVIQGGSSGVVNSFTSTMIPDPAHTTLTAKLSFDIKGTGESRLTASSLTANMNY